MKTKTAKDPVSITELYAEAEKAALKWAAEKRSSIERDVTSILDKRAEEVVFKLLGFDNRWGRMEVDHCNGRAGESAAGDFIRAKAGAAVHAWLEAQVGKLPKLPKSAVKSLRDFYLEVYRNTLNDELYRAAQHKAQADAAAYVQSLTAPAPAPAPALTAP